MQKVCLFLTVVSLTCATGWSFDVPRHVFEFEKLGKAQEQSVEDKKPLLLVYADPKKEVS